LGVASLWTPLTASRFLLGFASSRAAHFTELSIRGLAGAAFIVYAPRMSQPSFSLVSVGCWPSPPYAWHCSHGAGTIVSRSNLCRFSLGISPSLV